MLLEMSHQNRWRFFTLEYRIESLILNEIYEKPYIWYISNTWIALAPLVFESTWWRVLRYQRGNQNPYIEEEQTTQWPKEKVQKDKQRSTKHTHKTKDGVTRTPLKTGGELMCSGRVSSSCSTSDTRCVNLATNPMNSHEWGKDREVLTTSGTYQWSFVTRIFHNGQPSHGGDRKTFEVMTST